MPVKAQPGASNLLDSWFEGWAVAANGAAKMWTTICTRPPGPFDIPRWLEVITVREPPSWTLPNTIVFDAPVARLRDFTRRGASQKVVPTLVLPPQAGHDSCIVDYSKDQSQMGAIMSAGLQRAFTLDWKGATDETKDATIDDYLDVIDMAVEHCGGHVNLIGDCQGGWLATIYAALHPERVNTLTLAGAPIDFHAGEPIIHEVIQHLAPGGDLGFYEALVAMDGGVLKGEHMLSGFMLIQPSSEVSRQYDLFQHLDDPGYIARYAEFEDWFKHTQDIPGGFYLWIVEHLFRDNALISGSMRIRGKHVRLSNLDMPLQLLAGAGDHITPPDQVFAIASLASTPDELIYRDVAGGGHLGLFMSHEALREHWPGLLAKVRAHS